MTEKSETATQLPKLSPKWQRAFAWVENCVGGRIVRAQRQARWRPAWFLDVEPHDGGPTIPLYFRGQRGEVANGFVALEREAKLLAQLERDGLPVPHVFGLCPDPGGIVMAAAPGKANLATAENDEQRHAVLDHYIELLAKMHQLDTKPYEALGLPICSDPQSAGLGDFQTWVANFRASKTRPEPALEFLIGWILRNVPAQQPRAALLCADSGQFLFENNRVTAIIDLELAYIGDPAADLGALRCRDLSEPLGDLQRAIDSYQRLSGFTISREALDFHTVRFATCTPLAVAPMVANALPGLDFMQYLIWYVVYSRTPLEVLAAAVDMTLEPLPTPQERSSREQPAYAALELRFENPVANEDQFQTYERETSLRLASYVARAERYGRGLEEDNLDDLTQLLGKRPATRQEGDQALEDYVCRAGPERDPELIRLLHRRLQREEFLLQPLMREFTNAKMQTLK